MQGNEIQPIQRAGTPYTTTRKPSAQASPPLRDTPFAESASYNEIIRRKRNSEQTRSQPACTCSDHTSIRQIPEARCFSLFALHIVHSGDGTWHTCRDQSKRPKPWTITQLRHMVRGRIGLPCHHRIPPSPQPSLQPWTPGRR